MTLSKIQSVLFSVAFLAGAPGYGQTVAYQSIGEFGEPVFSDIQDPSAELIELPVSDAVSLSSDELISQMLSVAESLEQARLTRQAQRQALRNERPPFLPEVPAQGPASQTDHFPLFFPYPHHPRGGHHPEPPVEPAPQTKTFRFEPDL
ncbi:MAG: hypothetical protein ACFHXK_00310 [bacterium]